MLNNFRCQLVIANLLARTLINLAPTFDRHLVDDGALLLSGILEDQVAGIISAFGSEYIFDTVSRDSWAMIMASRQ